MSLPSDLRRLHRLRPLLETRAAVVRGIRRFFEDRDFLEIDTPVRLPIPAMEQHIDAIPADGAHLRTSPELHMKRLLAAITVSCPVAARAEVLDKQPSVIFLIAAAASASFLAYTAARRAKGRLALLGLLPILVFLPALLEQLDPIMREAIFAEAGPQYLFCVWLGPASVLAAFSAGLRRRTRSSDKPIPSALFLAAVSVLGGLGLSTLSGLSAVWACLIVAVGVLINGFVAGIEDGHA